MPLLLPGLSKKPSLSAQRGPVVQSGENVTLLCSSKCAFDQFHLLGNWENLGRPLVGGRGPHGTLQAAFPLGPGTPAHSGVYRCYGSFTLSPYVWSDPSDPCSCVSQVRTLLIQIKIFFMILFIYIWLHWVSWLHRLFSRAGAPPQLRHTGFSFVAASLVVEHEL